MKIKIDKYGQLIVDGHHKLCPFVKDELHQNLACGTWCALFVDYRDISPGAYHVCLFASMPVNDLRGII